MEAMRVRSYCMLLCKPQHGIVVDVTLSARLWCSAACSSIIRACISTCSFCNIPIQECAQTRMWEPKTAVEAAVEVGTLQCGLRFLALRDSNCDHRLAGNSPVIQVRPSDVRCFSSLFRLIHHLGYYVLYGLNIRNIFLYIGVVSVRHCNETP